MGLASLISSIEKANPDWSVKVDERLGTDMVFLPNRQHKIWRNGEAEPLVPPGVSDVMALSMIFAGIFPANLLKEFTYEQFFFYSLFLMKVTKQKKDFSKALQNILNGTPSLSQHIYFLHKVTGFAPGSSITVWRARYDGDSNHSLLLFILLLFLLLFLFLLLILLLISYCS
eukprot:TRINITY_DN25455_c0_g1_i1.p1 TRINITY_DN25455_c0_g1~~TRINITY_DN25455_c0_g1_i1.p1  ORF type:complete len:196 (+),score=35.54 TRINITY_DN25455_c0_g1_i1:75-590(+)